MNIGIFLQAMKALVQAAYGNRNDPKRWEGWVDSYGPDDDPVKIKLNGKFKKVSLEMTGIRFEIEHDGETIVLEGRPGPHHMEVFLNGVVDHEARFTNPTPKNTLNHPLRIGIDCRPVTMDGHETRFNLRFNG